MSLKIRFLHYSHMDFFPEHLQVQQVTNTEKGFTRPLRQWRHGIRANDIHQCWLINYCWTLQ